MSEENEDKILRVYEVGYHLVPTILEGEVEGAVGAIRTVIEKAGGSFIAEGAPLLTKLAYSMIAKVGGKRVPHDRGYFGWIKFEADTSAAEAVRNHLVANGPILRSMVFETVREDTRAKIKMPLREVKRTDTLKAAPRRETSAVSTPVSEEEIDKAIETLTLE